MADKYVTNVKLNDDIIKLKDAELTLRVTNAEQSIQQLIDADFLPKSGGTMTGEINMGNHKITNVSAPTSNSDAVNKEYADLIASHGYTLPVATDTELGGVKAKTKQTEDTQEVRVDSTGHLFTKPGAGAYTLPQATNTDLGGVKAENKAAEDTQPVRIASDGHLFTKPGAGAYTLPQATNTDLGGVKAENKTADDTQAVRIDSTGHLFTKPAPPPTPPTPPYTLPQATDTTLGGIKAPATSAEDTQPVKIDSTGHLFTKPAPPPTPPTPPYTLPQANSTILGGVKADAKAGTDTQPVRIGTDGKLYTAQSGGDTNDCLKKCHNNDNNFYISGWSDGRNQKTCHPTLDPQVTGNVWVTDINELPEYAIPCYYNHNKEVYAQMFRTHANSMQYHGQDISIYTNDDGHSYISVMGIEPNADDAQLISFKPGAIDMGVTRLSRVEDPLPANDYDVVNVHYLKKAIEDGKELGVQPPIGNDYPGTYAIWLGEDKGKHVMIQVVHITGKSVSCTTEWGSMYEGSVNFGYWPYYFAQTPTIISVQNDSTSGFFFEGWDYSGGHPPTSTAIGVAFFARPNAATYNGSFTITAIGVY